MHNNTISFIIMLAYMNNLIVWYGSDVSGYCNHGLGPIVAFVGIAGAAYPRVIKMIKK